MLSMVWICSKLYYTVLCACKFFLKRISTHNSQLKEAFVVLVYCIFSEETFSLNIIQILSSIIFQIQCRPLFLETRKQCQDLFCVEKWLVNTEIQRDGSTPNAKYVFLYVPRNGIQFLKDIKDLRNTLEVLVRVETYRLSTGKYKLLYTQARESYQQAQEHMEVKCFRCMSMHGSDRNKNCEF